MALTSRQKLLDRAINVRDATLFIIATEGRHTEKIYFDSFASTRVHVHVAAATDDASAPEHVLQRLSDLRTQYELEDNDFLWLVLDVDRWGAAKLSRVCAEAMQSRVKLAISNPCFEVWLCLHLDACDDNAIATAAAAGRPGHSAGQKLKGLLRRTLGSYNEARLDMTRFQPQIEYALQRARATDPTPEGRWPASTGTHVYRLVEQILASLRQ